MSPHSSTSFWDTLIRVFLIFGIPRTTWKILPLRTNRHSKINSLPYSRITNVLQSHICYVGILSYFVRLSVCFTEDHLFILLRLISGIICNLRTWGIYDVWNIRIKRLYNVPFLVLLTTETLTGCLSGCRLSLRWSFHAQIHVKRDTNTEKYIRTWSAVTHWKLNY